MNVLVCQSHSDHSCMPQIIIILIFPMKMVYKRKAFEALSGLLIHVVLNPRVALDFLN